MTPGGAHTSSARRYWQKRSRPRAEINKEKHVAGSGLVLIPGATGAGIRVLKVRRAARAPWGDDNDRKQRTRMNLESMDHEWRSSTQTWTKRPWATMVREARCKGKWSHSWLMNTWYAPGLLEYKGSCPECHIFFFIFWFPHFMSLNRSKTTKAISTLFLKESLSPSFATMIIYSHR